MNNGIDEIKEINENDEIEKTTEVTDPFDEELEDKMIINDTYFLASRDAVTLDGMQFSFMKPPYMNFEDHIQVKRKLKEAFTQLYLRSFRKNIPIAFILSRILHR